MVRKRLYAKRTASAEYEQLDLFGLLEEEQRQADRTAEQVRGYEITGRTGSVDSADGTRGSPPRTSSASAPPRPAKPRRDLW